jgi:hypothetical protein
MRPTQQRTSIRRLALLASATVGVLGLLASGCTGDDSPGSPRGEATSTGRTTGSAASAVTRGIHDDTDGPAYDLIEPTGERPLVRDGQDWTMPGWVRPAEFSGFFSEDAAESEQVMLRSIDVSWKQIAPTEGAPLDLDSAGKAQGMSFEPLGQQLAEPGPYWFRLFASGTDWAPAWVIEKCGVSAIGKDYDGQRHLPIWDDCVWDALRTTWARLLRDQGLLADPNFRFAYVPGGFTWVEFDYEMISSAVRRGELTQDTYLRWYARMLKDLTAIAGPQAGQLVFTGEDYPFGPFGTDDDLLARKAVDAGLGIRTGITELANFHLSEAPAYGSRILPDGHLVVDDSAPPHRPGTVVATENECYVDCGYKAQDPAYTVIQSNLKSLQLQMNWMYVVPGPSLFEQLPEHWDWVRLSLGQHPQTSPDAWAALRDAEDRYWADPQPPFDGTSGRAWRGQPVVRNLERWLVQVDVPGRAMARRSSAEVHRGDLEPDNGVAHEGLRTDVAAGSRSLAFTLDDRFLSAGTKHPALVKVTFLDDGTGAFRVRHSHGETAPVRLGGSGRWRTATFRVDLDPDHSLPRGTDLWLDTSGPGDLTVRFVRVVRLAAP